MKKYEVESLLKSFLLFFILQFIVLWLIFSQNFSLEKEKLNENLLSQMKLCSYTLKCKEFDFDFVDKKKQPTSKLLKNEKEIYTLFNIPSSKEYLLKLFISKKKYTKQIETIKNNLKNKFLPYVFLIMILSFLFAYYSLYPLKKALKINEEFIKDILHDYNTPISSLLINFKLLKKEIGENTKIQRMKKSIDTILSLQNNLKFFLQNNILQSEKINLKNIIEERVTYFEELFPSLKFTINLADISIQTNKDAFTRIIDNLLSNACKYNLPENGFIKIYLENKSLVIENSSNGIKNPKKIFQRYYKENQRGIGLGLNIVKKLCDDMNIPISIESELKKTTKVKLNLVKVILD